MSIAANLRRLREAAGLSLAELGRRAGMSASGVRGIETRPEREPFLFYVERLAAALGVTVQELAAAPAPEAALPPPMPAEQRQPAGHAADDGRLFWLEGEVAALTAENARLVAENDRLEQERDAAQARIADLEAALRVATAQEETKQARQEMEAEIVRLYQAGESTRDITDQVPVSRQTVCNVVKAAGLIGKRKFGGDTRKSAKARPLEWEDVLEEM